MGWQRLLCLLGRRRLLVLLGQHQLRGLQALLLVRSLPGLHRLLVRQQRGL
jgi:hypothetical protein